MIESVIVSYRQEIRQFIHATSKIHFNQHPARMDLLLLRAGDVEKNPGPPCDACERSIRKDHLKSALTCIEGGCEARCHSSETCSRIARRQGEKKWSCKLHKEDRVVNRVPAEGKIHCSGCHRTIRKDHLKSPFTCMAEECEEKCHNNETCSGIGRYEKEQRWLCKHHTTDTEGQIADTEEVAGEEIPSTRPTSETTGANGRQCDNCLQKIRRGYSSLLCSIIGCNNVCHSVTKCSKIS